MQVWKSGSRMWLRCSKVSQKAMDFRNREVSSTKLSRRYQIQIAAWWRFSGEQKSLRVNIRMEGRRRRYAECVAWSWYSSHPPHHHRPDSYSLGWGTRSAQNPFLKHCILKKTKNKKTWAPTIIQALKEAQGTQWQTGMTGPCSWMENGAVNNWSPWAAGSMAWPGLALRVCGQLQRARFMYCRNLEILQHFSTRGPVFSLCHGSHK